MTVYDDVSGDDKHAFTGVRVIHKFRFEGFNYVCDHIKTTTQTRLGCNTEQTAVVLLANKYGWRKTRKENTMKDLNYMRREMY